MSKLVPGMGFGHKLENGEFDDIQRVLYVDRKLNKLVAIPALPQRSAGRIYYRGYKEYTLDEIEKELDDLSGEICTVNIKQSSLLMLTDNEILNKITSKRQRSSTRLLKMRDEKWDLIVPLLAPDRLPLLFDKHIFTSVVAQRAQELENDEHKQQALKNRITQALYQYWAGGSHKNALIPLFLNCGGRGKNKTRGKRKLGRPNAPTAAGASGEEGFQLSDNDIRIIEHCWNNFLVHGATVGMACRKMWSEFYSDRNVDQYGITNTEWYPVSKRPTKAQFRYWGKKQTGDTARRKLAKRGQFEHSERPLPGVANDGIWAVGQLGAIDSTPTDLELVSTVSRLDRIGIANREMLVDALYSYIPGFYQGLTPPCAATVKLAVYNAMMDKTDWLKDLGLSEECPPEDWLNIQFQSLIADNTDGRSEKVYEDLLDSGVMLSINHIRTYRSDLNALVETGHHSIHRLGDHKQTGTNHGRRTERGETRAEVAACHTLIESIRDTVRTIHIYNTMELPDKVMSLAMKRDGVRPTRLDMTRWEIEQGHIATLLMNIDEARAQLLPLHEGVFTQSGVRLLRQDTGKKRTFIRALRYVSKDPRVLSLMEQARRDGPIDHLFRVDPFNIRRIWFLHIETGGLIELSLAIKDRDLAIEATLFDVVAQEKQDAVDRFQYRENQERAVGDLEQRLEKSNQSAREAYHEDLEKHGKPLSQKEIREGKEANLRQERQRSLFGMPIALSEEDVDKFREEDDPLGEDGVDDKGAPIEEKMNCDLFAKALHEEEACNE